MDKLTNNQRAKLESDLAERVVNDMDTETLMNLAMEHVGAHFREIDDAELLAEADNYGIAVAI
jgi:hypothetical protein